MNHKPSYPRLALHVAGRWLERASAGERPVIDPSDGTTLAMLPLAGPAELDAAAEAAERGFRAWRRTLAHERCQVVRRAAALMRERASQIATVLTLEQGKPLAESTREVILAADIVDFQAEEARRLYGRLVPPRLDGILSQSVLRQPIGPVAAFTPWNFPANLPARKLGSALAAGCSVVIKPAEETPGTCMLLVRCFLEAGVPPETLSMVCGDPEQISSMLIAHQAIRKASLTGSVAVGRKLGTLCAERIKRFTGELGGHAPVIVCADADLDFALKLSVPAKFRNAGQVCASPIRFYVQRSAYNAFCERFARGARALCVGSGLDPQTHMGPLTHSRRIDEMERLVADARDRGARILAGGARIPGSGFFYAPTVIVDAPPASLVQRIEPFGPLALIEPFDKLEEAIAKANALPYALGAYAFTRELSIAHRLAEEIEAGMVGINHYGISQPEMPFGGWKESGIGQEMGTEGLLHYTELKTVVVGTSA